MIKVKVVNNKSDIVVKEVTKKKIKIVKRNSKLFRKFRFVKKQGKMKNSKNKSRKMLAYSKEVLNKVSFDAKLFKKELSKAYQNLLQEEVEELMNWVMEKFGPQYVLKPISIQSR